MRDQSRAIDPKRRFFHHGKNAVMVHLGLDCMIH
jgi:hypothetical protein